MSMARKLIRLDSMTLRGIGSYFHGAELKLHPLTILCGSNGSGKSTWFSAIDLLQRSSEKGMLPFAFDASDSNCHDMQVTNARLSNASLDELDADPKADARFGPWGTIGVNCTSIAAGSLTDRADASMPFVSDHPAAKLLWLGRCSKGSRFRFRIAHSSDGMNEYHQDFVELVLDGSYTIRMTRLATAGHPREPRRSPYLLACSRAFLSPEGDSGLMEILRFDMPDPIGDPTDVEPLVALPEDLYGEQLIDRCIELCRALLKHTVRGFFRITAIRDRQVISSLEDSPLAPTIQKLVEELEQPLEKRRDRRTSEELIQAIRDRLVKLAANEWLSTRYVGPHGEAALALWRHFLEQADQVSAAAFAADVCRPLDKLLGTTVSDPPESEATDLYRFTNACLRQPQGPARLSSGFHQLMPIIVQSALMEPGEILAVENPEVHLHPSLQLDIAEFLMNAAKSGKAILVETHSDLIIRRLIRAVLDEELPQEALNIQIVSLYTDADGGGAKHSVSERLKTNERGHIANWPEGFLDDDIRESRRLFEIMYGAPLDGGPEKFG